ncbi:glycoside hydrolase family 88 protein [Psychrosphaera sp. B3R10]|uniref:glycoside hydrolase family 88/105 protein n=1 Tax=unclassified Psychrosphaera TaxID=2641570 RepID=UPI001C08BA84|nr:MULTISPECIES: glycoside hydrolase family 88 protein [unclassified Psychrosphaera]MBU2881047.1 glycoside hydrolase family 88 protein [Psychrosphaera sp. I2R16]MBU2989971.1 glycoside hydrolase family 88 protein [Psychrosphaera sp. B3R10]MDO6719137.1 glycoside hydrolase family 88 protein [Psychrosphaera sp. 1_MG-2023]
MKISNLIGLTASMIASLLTIASCADEPAHISDPTHTKVPAPVKYAAPTTIEQQFSKQFSLDNIQTIANQVADYQLSLFDIRSNQMRPEGRASGIPNGWMYATLHIGLEAYAAASGQQEYEQAVINLSQLNQWKPGPRLYHADDHAVSDVYLELYEKYGFKYQITPTKKVLDGVLAAQKTNSLVFDNNDKYTEYLDGRKFVDPSCTYRWCWADAIFMAPPVWAHMAKISGNNKYLTFMDSEFWATTEYLFDEKESLFLRDSRYFERRDDEGRKIYWSRGNGWVLAGIARTLRHLPDDFKNKSKYEFLFTRMSKRLVALQNESGNWPSSLLDASDSVARETSGTALIVYAMAWGVNNGYLDKQTYLPVITKGWDAIVSNVHPSGQVGWVQQVAFAPGSASKNDSQLYGSGAVLLAAAEITNLLQSSN